MVLFKRLRTLWRRLPDRAKLAFESLVVVMIVAGGVRLAVTDWSLTQPTATLAAGGLAVSAAGIAYAGVRYAQGVAVSSTKAQLNHQARVLTSQRRQHQAQLDHALKVERQKHRRTSAHDVMVRTVGDLTSAKKVVIDWEGFRSAAWDDGIDGDELDQALITFGHQPALESALSTLETDAHALLIMDFAESYLNVLGCKTLIEQMVGQRPGAFDLALIDHQWVEATTSLQDAYRSL